MLVSDCCGERLGAWEHHQMTADEWYLVVAVQPNSQCQICHTHQAVFDQAGLLQVTKSPEMRTASVVVRVFDSWRCAEKQADPCLGAGIDWIWSMGSSRMAGKVILFFRASEMQPNSGQNI